MKIEFDVNVFDLLLSHFLAKTKNIIKKLNKK